jgi:hypothetical protein
MVLEFVIRFIVQCGVSFSSMMLSRGIPDSKITMSKMFSGQVDTRRLVERLTHRHSVMFPVLFCLCSVWYRLSCRRTILCVGCSTAVFEQQWQQADALSKLVESNKHHGTTMRPSSTPSSTFKRERANRKGLPAGMQQLLLHSRGFS